jgi:arabinose-5-phosphate isomerase
MLKELLSNEKQYIDHFFQHLDLIATEKILEALGDCKGTLFFSGIGKSEAMAKKIAVTMASTGTRALFMAPTNALHGDIGILSNNDLFIMLSKGGETEELLNLVPFLHDKGAKTIAIVSDGASRLARLCNMNITLPLARELCPYNLVPTTSTQIQMIFGDLLTIALMKRKNFSRDQYAENHPSGKIGRRVKMKVQDLMLTGNELPLCNPSSHTLDTLVELSKKRCGCVLIVNEDNVLQGIFTDGDLGRILTTQGPESLQKPISEMMSLNPKHISKEKLAWEALQQMEANPAKPITVLAVTDEHHTVVGLIRMHDILQAGI